MTSLSYQQIEMFGKDLPDHETHVTQYRAAGLTEVAAYILENRAARIITLGRRAILEIGNELLQARREAAHGTWGAFLARCGMAERTAQNYINVAEKFGDRPEVLKLLRPTALYALASDSADAQTVETIIADAQAGNAPTVADVQAKVRGKPRSSAPAPEPTPAPVTATTYASAAEGHLLEAQNAGPGSTARGVALQRALLTLPNAPEPDRAALTIRYHELRCEHARAIQRNGNSDLAGIMQLMGWQYVQRRDGGTWRDPLRQHEIEFAPGELPIAARIVLERPEIGAEELCRLVEAEFSGREPEAASTASTSVQPTQPAPELPADIALFASIYGMTAEADVYYGEPAVWLLWPNDDKNDVMALPLDEARQFLRGGAASLASSYAPADCLFQRAARAGYDILDVTEDEMMEVLGDDLEDGTLLSVADLEARLGGEPAAQPAGIGRTERTQINDLWQQTQAALDDSDRAHALRCLWQMVVLAAGSEREAREWAAMNAE